MTDDTRALREALDALTPIYESSEAGREVWGWELPEYLMLQLRDALAAARREPPAGLDAALVTRVLIENGWNFGTDMGNRIAAAYNDAAAIRGSSGLDVEPFCAECGHLAVIHREGSCYTNVGGPSPEPCGCQNERTLARLTPADGEDDASEYGRLLAARDRLIGHGVDPSELLMPEPPADGEG